MPRTNAIDELCDGVREHARRSQLDYPHWGFVTLLHEDHLANMVAGSRSIAEAIREVEGRIARVYIRRNV